MPLRIAIFPGSFDPFTKGHFDVVNRGMALFDKIIIAIGFNSTKSSRYFPVELIKKNIETIYQNDPRVEVVVYNLLTANIAQQYSAQFILRGVRNTTDFEFENTISQVNRDILPGLETIFLITSPKYAYINSSIVREIHRFGANVDKYVPYHLEEKSGK